MSEELKMALSNLEEETVAKLIQERLDGGVDPLTIIAECRDGMADVGKRYEAQEYYVSDLIMAGEVFKQAMAKIGEKFKQIVAPNAAQWWSERSKVTSTTLARISWSVCCRQGTSMWLTWAWMYLLKNSLRLSRRAGKSCRALRAVDDLL